MSFLSETRFMYTWGAIGDREGRSDSTWEACSVCSLDADQLCHLAALRSRDGRLRKLRQLRRMRCDATTTGWPIARRSNRRRRRADSRHAAGLQQADRDLAGRAEPAARRWLLRSAR